MQDTLTRWRSEKTAAFLSDAVAAVERDPTRAKLFRDMAASAEKQAGILAKDLKPVPGFTPSLRARITVFLLGIFGPRAMRHVLSASKVRGVSVYRGKATSSGGEGAEGHPWPTSVEEVGRQHKNYGSGTLRAGVFGVNDGLVSNTCLVMGVAGAGTGANVILLTGVAGLLAGAFSMGAGEFISMLSQKEMFEHQIGQEKDELERYPKEEAEELALIYAARGIPLKEARHHRQPPHRQPREGARYAEPRGARAQPRRIGLAHQRGHLLLPHLFRRRELAADPLRVRSIRPRHSDRLAHFGHGAVLRRRRLEPVLRAERLSRRGAHAGHRRGRGRGDLLHRLPVRRRGVTRNIAANPLDFGHPSLSLRRGSGACLMAL